MSDPARSLHLSARVPSRGALIYAMVLMALIQVVNYMDRLIIAGLVDPIKRDLGLSDTEIGLLTGLVFSLFYASAGIPLARLADKTSRRSIITWSMVVWGSMTAVGAAAQNFLQLALARVGVAIGEAGCVPAAHAMISDLFPPQKRASAIALFSAGAPIGVFLALALGGWVAQAYGWRATLFFAGAASLAVAALVALTLREPPRGAADGVHVVPDQSSFLEAAKRLLLIPSYRHLLVALALGVFTSYGISNWLPSYFIRSFGVTQAQAGIIVGSAAGLAMAAGMVVGGLIGDWLARRGLRWLLWQSVFTNLVTVPIYVTAFLAKTPEVAGLMTFLASFVGAVGQGPAMASVQNSVPPSLRATASSFLLFSTAIVGLGAGSLAIGMLSDALTPIYGKDALRYSLLLAIPVVLWVALHTWLASRTIERDAMLATKNPGDIQREGT